MLAHATMPLSYWNDAFSSAVYLINRLPSAPLGMISPYEKLFHEQPSYQFLRVFGCLCFPNLRPYNSHKLQFRSALCLFIRYSPCHKGYRCQDKLGRIFVIRHVTFHESVFPYQAQVPKSDQSKPRHVTSSKLLVLTLMSTSTTSITTIDPSLSPLTAQLSSDRSPNVSLTNSIFNNRLGQSPSCSSQSTSLTLPTQSRITPPLPCLHILLNHLQLPTHII